MQLCSKPRGARAIEPETFRRRGQLLSRPPTTGPNGGLCCAVPARSKQVPCSCPGPYVPLAPDVAVFGSCHTVPAWCGVCGVHPPAPNRVYVGTFAYLPSPPSVRGCSAYALGVILPRCTCLRLILFWTCPPLCVGALWPIPAWVLRDVQRAGDRCEFCPNLRRLVCHLTITT